MPLLLPGGSAVTAIARLSARASATIQDAQNPTDHNRVTVDQPIEIDDVRVGADAGVDEVVALLALLGEGELTTRLPVTTTRHPLVQAVHGLAERLEADAREAERRVHERTEELAELNADVIRLSEFGNLLQACENFTEAHQVIEHEVGLLFPDLAGALYLFNASRNVLELKASWGGLPLDASMPREHCWALRRGQQHLVPARSPRLSCRHTVERWGDSICYPVTAQGETLGILHLMGRSLQRPGQTLLTPWKQRLGVTMAEQTGLSLANLHMRDTLGQQALRDPLTGLYNRRFVDECIGLEISRTDRRGTALGVLMADIDHFKRFNDMHGHDAGDAILAAVASAILATVRGDDIVCRYGGEELLILLPDVGDGLLARAERIRASVAATTVTHNGSHLPPVTISIGAALYPQHGQRPIDVLRLADAALYGAKHRGRNQVVLAPVPDDVTG